MTDDLPDHSTFSIIKAVDEDGDLVTVLVDASGAIVSVMKGDYAGALHTIKLDSEHRMIGRMLFSVDAIIADTKSKAAVATDDSLDSDTVPAGKYWRITNILAWNYTSHSTRVLFMKASGGTLYRLKTLIDVPPQFSIQWDGEVWLDVGDHILIGWEGIQIDDSLRFDYQGTQISKV